MKVSLLVVKGSPEGKEIPVNRSPFVIGRDAKCSLRPNNPMVSEVHCEIQVGNRSVALRDLGSEHGTSVNGVPVTEQTLLKNGDQIQIGKLCFGVKIATDAPVGRAPRPAAAPIGSTPGAAIPGAAVPGVPPSKVSPPKPAAAPPKAAPASAAKPVPAKAAPAVAAPKAGPGVAASKPAPAKAPAPAAKAPPPKPAAPPAPVAKDKGKPAKPQKSVAQAKGDDEDDIFSASAEHVADGGGFSMLMANLLMEDEEEPADE